ncbi:cytochrome P450 [Streptomyces sp. NPDC021093]|uniref:cytochrome P450 n=1 Tax=Streptomyces sp. NPDC021093 TaxID=3365112 RepID=UPI003798976A
MQPLADAGQSLAEIDITSEQLYDEKGYPWEEWDRLRTESPVHWYQRPGYEPFWALTAHEDISLVARSPQLFSCRQRTAVETPDEIEPWETERERRSQVYGHVADYPAGLGFMDAPLHRQVRQAMYPCFTPKAMAAMEERFYDLSTGYVAELVERLDEHGTADVAHDLAARLPLAAIFDLLGVPHEDWDHLFAVHQDTASAFHKGYKQEEGEDAQVRFMNAMIELDRYMSELARTRMAEGGGSGTDVLSRLAKASVLGDPLAFHDISYQLFNLVQAGNGTARNAIAGGIKAFLENPDQLQKLIDDPTLLDGAVEEILRWTSVAVVMCRTALQDTEIRGRRIRKGETVAMFFPAANRDPEAFPDPYAFDITRSPNRHIAFGGNGEHRCIGAALARAELRAMFRALLPVLPTLELHGESKMLVLRLLISEFVQLPVRRKGAVA